MFTWICPRCGREVPPSFNECPYCAERERTAQPKPVAATAPPEAPRAALRAPKPTQEQKGKELPGWLLSVLFALGFLVLGAGGYYAYRHFSTPPPSAAPGGPKLQGAAPPALPTAKTSLIQRYVEVTGIRLLEDAAKKTQV